jgi:hypothetical protein
MQTRNYVSPAACVPFLLALSMMLRAQSGLADKGASDLDVSALRSQLRWKDEATKLNYLANKRALTEELLRAIDSFVEQTYGPAGVTPGQIAKGVDSLVGRSSSEIGSAVALGAQLSRGKFLVLAVEVPRGGTAIPEDIVSFRAYTIADGSASLVSHLELEREFLVDLHILPLPSAFPDSIGLIAWADLPPLTPFSLIVRVLNFDGESFRVVWEPTDFITGNVQSFVALTSVGFDLNTLNSRWTTKVLQRYTISSGTVEKLEEIDLGPR